MAIIQISKIQVRSGNLVDLPQLDEAELGWASDDKRLFIGKVTPNENIEVLTSYSDISFSQIDGSVGNLDINPITADEGQVLAYNANNNTWENRGAGAGGVINLGDVSNVKIDGGAISYVLETDGTGNLTWAPKGVVVAYIENVTNANPGVVTTEDENFFVNGQEITITSTPGMTELNGNTYFCNVVDAYSFILCSDQLLTPIDTTSYGVFPYTNVTATNTSNDRVTIGNSALFTVNDTVKFTDGMANTGITANVVYYVYDLPTSTTMRVSTSNDGNLSNIVNLTTQSGLTANVYYYGARIVSAVGGSGTTPAGGSNTQIQYNSLNILQGSPDFTLDYAASPKLLTLNGNANVGNLNASSLVTATRLISNIATGTAPFTVSSTTKVANLYSDRAANADSVYTVNQNTGTFYPVFVSANTNANYPLGSNSALSFNALTGNLSTTFLNVTSNANVGNIGAINGFYTGNVSVTANVIAGNVYANTGNIIGNLITGTLTTQAQPNVTSLGNGTQVTISGNLNPNVNITYNLGNATNRWNDLYLSGTTIYLGNATIESDANGVVITNPNGGTFTVDGTSASNASALLNGNSSIIVTANSNVNISANGVANVLSVTATGANITGTANITGNANVGNIGGNNSIFTLMTGTLTTNAQPNVTSLGTLISLAVNGNTTSGNVYANSGTIGASLLTGTLTTNAQPNVTSLGTLTSLAVTGNTTSGNVYANAGTIGASLLTGTLTTNAQPNVTSLGTLSSLAVTATVTAGNLSANSGTVSGANVIVSANVISGNVYANSGTIGANLLTGNLITGTLTTNAQPNITSVGSLTSLSVAGNISAGNVSATRGTFTTVVGSLTTNAQPNVTSVGTLTSLIVSGNTISGNVYANTGRIGASLLTGTLTTASQPNITSIGNLTGLTLTGVSNLGPVSNVIITGGNANQILKTDGAGTLSWVDPTGGYYLHTQNSANTVWVINHNLNRQYLTVEPIDANGDSYTGRYDYPLINYTNANSLTMTFTSAVAGWAAITGGGTNINSVTVGNSTPGGVNTQVQFNDAGALNGSLGLVFDKVTGTLSVTGTTNTGNLLTTNITSGSNTTAGSITGNWTLTAGSRLEATYADLAEYYEADKEYDPGTVLEFGGDKEVTLAEDGTTRVAGVVSTNPAYAMNAKCAGIATPIALQGRVPVKVRGNIKKGDMLVSGGAGYARPTNNPTLGSVIGKALENFSGVEGVIEVAVGRL